MIRPIAQWGADTRSRGGPGPWLRLARRRRLGRWLAFNSVGAVGFALQLASLVVLTDFVGLHYLAATVIAVEAAILNNFFWHERCIWGDRRAGGARRCVSRLARFNAGVALTSIGGNVVLMWAFVGRFGLSYAAANAMTIVCLSLLNFALCDLLVFRDIDRPSGGGSR